MKTKTKSTRAECGRCGEIRYFGPGDSPGPIVWLTEHQTEHEKPAPVDDRPNVARCVECGDAVRDRFDLFCARCAVSFARQPARPTMARSARPANACPDCHGPLVLNRGDSWCARCRQFVEAAPA